MNKRSLDAINLIDQHVENATSEFYHSAVAARTIDPELGHVFGELEFTVVDILLVAIIAEVHTLITGPSGDGKTQLAQLVCQGVFGEDNWFLQKLTPHLNEDVFTNVDMAKLKEGSLRDAVTPAHFLALPVTVFDEVNRTPAPLTNVLLGFLDGCIETRAGLKFGVGRRRVRSSGDGHDHYHVAIATMNAGKNYDGTFPLDLALSRRLTLRIPFGDLRPTPADIVSIYEGRNGHLAPPIGVDALSQLIEARNGVLKLPVDPLGFLYLGYLANLGRCPHLPSGYHPCNGSQEQCLKAECRVQKLENAFCPSVGSVAPGVGIFLKRTACALAGLRAARTVAAIDAAFDRGYTKRIDSLRQYVGRRKGVQGDFRELVCDKYLESLSVTLDDISALVPFVGLGKVWMAEEYVAKNFGGSEFLALQHYAQYAHQQLVGYIRQNGQGIRDLGNGGGITKLIQRLEHAERSTDPAILHTLEPLIRNRKPRRANQVALQEEMRQSRRSRNVAKYLLSD